MGINKIFIYIVALITLSGCVQSTAMVGPAITIASTGNISHKLEYLILLTEQFKKRQAWIQFRMFQRKLETNILKINLNEILKI